MKLWAGDLICAIGKGAGWDRECGGSGEIAKEDGDENRGDPRFPSDAPHFCTVQGETGFLECPLTKNEERINLDITSAGSVISIKGN